MVPGLLLSAATLTAWLLTALRSGCGQSAPVPDKLRDTSRALLLTGSLCSLAPFGFSGCLPSHLSAYESRRRALAGNKTSAAGKMCLCMRCFSQAVVCVWVWASREPGSEDPFPTAPLGSLGMGVRGVALEVNVPVLISRGQGW